MKLLKKPSPVFFLLAAGCLISSRPVGNEKYVVNTYESIVTWKGYKAFVPDQGHSGYVSISKGELMMEKGQLVGGTVEVDMNTLADEFHRRNNNLISHLKSPDFFDVEKFPIATFAITQVAYGENINITGDLTIKGITHAITFPVQMEVKDGMLTANGNVIIDRTKWDVRYRSGKFYDDLADKTISDDIEFGMKIIAKK